MNPKFRISLRLLSVACIVLGIFAVGDVSRAAEPAAAKPNIPVLNWEPRSDWMNVKKAGAVGDGVADDTEAIQKVLSAVTYGSTVYFPPGNYRITESLLLKGPLLGVTMIGHGRATRLFWDGPEGGNLLVVNGVAQSRYIGFVLDGRGKAAIGKWHHNDCRFETEVRHQHMAFLNFTQAGLATDDKDSQALAETMYENCLFENCGAGVQIHSFNDYNHTFAGCEFRKCTIGISAEHGNFYARDCHFEESRTVDMLSVGEHCGSVRRCTSVNSSVFLYSCSSVASETIQDCHVQGWTAGAGAIQLQGAPVVLFDCVFSNPAKPDDSAVKFVDGVRMISSNNKLVGLKKLVPDEHPAHVYEIPSNGKGGAVRSASQSFLQETVAVPGKVFDAVRDFGARADGQTDDTQAIQKTIDAAREYGKNSIAYLPTGTYVVTSTLKVTGKNYHFGGSGVRSGLLWKGEEKGTIIEVSDADGVTLENMDVGSHNLGAMENAIDILQTGSNTPSRVTYDGVLVYGAYQKEPFKKGLHFRSLGPNEVVVLASVEGNLRFTDCAQATVLGNCTYEGSVSVGGKDKRRNGFLGFQTRLATVVTYGLYVRDNHSFVASDFYMEQSDAALDLEGNPNDPAGRVTVQGAKLDITKQPNNPDLINALAVRNYEGEIFFGPYQFYPGAPPIAISQQGERLLDLYLLGVSYYGTTPQLKKDIAMDVHTLGSLVTDAAPLPYMEDEWDEENVWPKVNGAFDDLRRLGETDLKINFPDSK